jgi:protein-tyrosine-phosphatase
LFLCTGNSGRSQIAGALLQQLGQDQVAVASAGSKPKPIHPAAIRLMRGYGIDLGDRRSKSLDEFTDQRFDFVITLCDKVREVCPTFPGQPEAIHWSTPDPAAAEGRAATNAAFTAVAADLQARIDHLVSWALPHAA